MANQNTMAAAGAAIKWTDKEWAEIAAWLLRGKGVDLLASDTLEEIKAKDIFQAQQVLPADRHRKQISIAQGFQGIRGKLRSILKQMRQNDLFAGQASAPASAPVPTVGNDVSAGDAGAQAQTTPALAAMPADAQREALASLVESARPLVAMVCEELARALVQASAQPGGAGLAALMGPLTQALAAHAPTNAQQLAAQPKPSAAAASPAREKQFRLPASNVDAGDAEEEASPLMEMQPLFDPKLPPSANSDFKPVIGLVASRAADYAELQSLYPQLRLSIVPVDAAGSPEIFRNCQRIIGLRNELPPATDDLLRRELSYRYVRLQGGAGQVREQLNAWLANPVSMSGTGAPRHERRPGNNKRRSKWPPRVVDRG